MGDWVKSGSSLLLLLLLLGAYPAEAGEKKGPDVINTVDDRAEKELSKEEIMFGNQQNVPAVEAPVNDGGGKKPGTKNDPMESNGTEGDDDKDYQYDEPYALYRKKRDLENENGGMSRGGQIRQRRKIRAEELEREMRSADSFFGHNGGFNGHHGFAHEE